MIVPSVILSLLAARAVNREELYIEKRLEGTLLAEATHVVSLINAELKHIEQELSSTAGVPESDFKEFFLQWKRESLLVGIPFLLSSSKEILWPEASEDLTNDEAAFLKWGEEFFSDKTTIPVYQNIAVVYKEAIIDELRESYLGTIQADKEFKRESSDEVPLGELTYGEGEDSESYAEEYMSQQAMSEFERSEPIRKKVYEQAKEKGQTISLRKVALSERNHSDAQKPKEESIFIAELLNFSQIITKSESGIIPRFINEKLRLIFWKKDTNGSIVGCVVNQAQVRERVLGILPAIYSPVRILTILDETGTPLITPQELPARNWRKPFVAREISEKLPHWEAAVYLTDPALISSRARVITFTMWILIAVLFISIVTGGTVVLKSLQSELELAQQKTTFVANVSHELKTPLTSIRMFAEMLKEKRQPDEHKKEQYLNLIASEAERLTRLINNVLNFSRREQGEKQYAMKKCDIVLLCQNIVESQRIRLEHNGFEVNFTSNSKQIFVSLDEESLKQAMINLLSNAEKYSKDIKKIDIEVRREDPFAVINIKDRGVGVPLEHAQKIFKEFYRANDTLTSRAQGTGLGLTIARQIIQDHGGDLLYFPRCDGGSTFQIKLPIIGKG